jgi:hypothetical protein
VVEREPAHELLAQVHAHEIAVLDDADPGTSEAREGGRFDAGVRSSR